MSSYPSSQHSVEGSAKAPRSAHEPHSRFVEKTVSALVIIVEDEPDAASALEYSLQAEGFQTRKAATGRAALELIATDPAPDLILLDLMLPDMAGTEVCRHLRMSDRTRHVPVLMLTAKGEEIDRVVGFEVGADDYVTKPYSLRELMLRVRAILRRAQTPEPEANEQSFGRLRVDGGGHRVWVDGAELTLTALEFRLLTTLMSRRGRVQTRDTLLEDVWDMSGEVTTRTVDTHVKRLRQKLGAAGAYIETLRGVGYRFRAQPDEAGVA
jgi:two-component system phosphate regulon response regulator PhoB